MNFLTQNIGAWWVLLPIITIAFNVAGFAKGYQESTIRKNSYGLMPWLFLWGVFVNADALIISPFFIIASLASFIFGGFNLFMLFFCAFWFVRGLGEMVYWFNQQFSTVIRVQPKDSPFYGKLVHDDSGWFVMQIFMQCIAVFALVGTIYFAHAWLQTI